MRGTRFLSFVCLFVYLRETFYYICEEYDFVSARLSKRFCVAVFASGGFFSLSSSLLRALFVRSLFGRKKWERKKLRALCLFSSERKTRKCCARKKRGSRSINISLARYDGACCVLSSSAYCGLGRRFMHHHARRKTTKETYFGCLTDQKNSLSIFNLTAKWKKKRTRRLKRKRRKMRMRSK